MKLNPKWDSVVGVSKKEHSFLAEDERSYQIIASYFFFFFWSLLILLLINFGWNAGGGREVVNDLMVGLIWLVLSYFNKYLNSVIK